MPDEIQAQIRGVIKRGAQQIHLGQVQAAPSSDKAAPTDYKGRSRPKLRRGLSYKLSKDGLNARVGIIGKRMSSQLFFARFLEYGARPGRKPKGQEITIYRRVLDHYGREKVSHPFILPPFDSAKDGIRRNIRAVTLRALQVVARSNPPDV